MDTAVLHLEDSDLDADLIRARLERSGLPLALERVSNRAGFVERISTRRYDLILSDYRVPSFDGLEALDLAKERQPGVPFIFVSGALGEEVAVETLRRGATDYVLKERLVRLVPAVERALAEARERAERRRTEERLRVALTAGRMGTWTLDLATGRMECSDSCRANYGRGPGEPFTYEDLTAAVLDEERPRWQRTVTEAVERAADLAVEYRTRWPDGSVHWVHVRGSCVTAGGRSVAMSGVSFDVTDRRRAEDELRAGEARWRALAEGMPQLVWATRPDGWCDYLSGQWEEFTGVPVAALLGFRWPDVLHPDDRDATFARWQAAVDGKTDYDVEYRIRRRDGVYRWFKVRGVPVRDDAGRVVQWIGSSTDIDDRKRAEETLREADRRKDEFLATLAHELRNPLAPIRNAIQVVKLTDDRAVRERAREMMDRQLGHMVRLIDDLLDMSRITRGKLDLRNERVDVSTIVTQAVETVRPLVEAAGHDLSVALPTGPVYLDGDPVRLAQVFSNLLNNAAKYTEAGGRIRLAVERQGSDVVVGVRDTGVGIPADMLPRVFDLFTQVDSARKWAQGGLGIGLTLVRRLVEMHGGSVEARSDGPGKGSEFVVRLPVAVEAQPHSKAGRAEDRPIPQSSLRVLVVDDNRDGADSLAEMLRILGNDTRTAYDGEEAVAAAADYRPDVVLLDIGLPRLNGYEACRRIRAQPGGKGVILIAQTGWGQEEDIRLSREAGFDRHLVKPVDPYDLMQVLADMPVGNR